MLISPKRSFSRLVALEASRILFRLGCDVRVYDPTGLPVKDDVQHMHAKVQELRELSRWSDGHVWVCPEQHGNLVCYHSFSLASFFRANSPATADRRLQKPNRLDTALNRQRTANSRPNPSHRTGFRRFSIFQHCQLASDPGPLDAHVHDPEPILDPQGVHAVCGCGRS